MTYLPFAKSYSSLVRANDGTARTTLTKIGRSAIEIRPAKASACFHCRLSLLYSRRFAAGELGTDAFRSGLQFGRESRRDLFSRLRRDVVEEILQLRTTRCHVACLIGIQSCPQLGIEADLSPGRQTGVFDDRDQSKTILVPSGLNDGRARPPGPLVSWVCSVPSGLTA